MSVKAFTRERHTHARSRNRHHKALSTLATIFAEFGDNLSPNSSPKTATVAEFGD